MIIQTDKGCYKGMIDRPMSAQKNRTIEFTAQTAADGSDDEYEGLHATPGPMHGDNSDEDAKLSTSP
jgi:hypothetical protein